MRRTDEMFIQVIEVYRMTCVTKVRLVVHTFWCEDDCRVIMICILNSSAKPFYNVMQDFPCFNFFKTEMCLEDDSFSRYHFAQGHKIVPYFLCRLCAENIVLRKFVLDLVSIALVDLARTDLKDVHVTLCVFDSLLFCREHGSIFNHSPRWR